MTKSNINLSIISKYRGELFGISIVSIIFFHYFNDVIKWRNHDVLYMIAGITNYIFGSIGVEIFLFLSGVGLYYSMCNDPRIKNFYSKRIRRVVIPYLIFGVFYWLIKDFIIYPESFPRLVMDLLLVTFWTNGNKVFWYIAFILVAYLLFPFLFRLMNCRIKGKDVSGIICYLLCVSWVAFCMTVSWAAPEYYEKTEAALSRFPVFFLGCRFGKKIRDNASFGAEEIILGVLGLMLASARMIIKYNVTDLGLDIPRRVTAFFFSIFIIFILTIFLEAFDLQKFNKAMTTVGSYSLELFMTHVGIRSILLNCGFRLHRIIYYMSYILLSVVLSLLLHAASQKSLKLIK